jgi:hypothetical protein
MQIPDDLILYTEEEAAELLRTKVKTLQNQRWKGRGPRSTKPGRFVMYRLSDLREYLERTASPQPPQPAP